MAERLHVVLSEGRAGESSRRSLEEELVVGLAGRPGVALSIVPHLYDLSAEGPAMEHLRSIAGPIVVLSWLYPRAAFWVLDANGIEGRLGFSASLSAEEADADEASSRRSSGRTIWGIDLRTQREAGPVLEEIARIQQEVLGEASTAQAAAHSGNGKVRIDETTQTRWYPVIDYGRCGNCMECLNFCLFGVFGLDETEQIIVEQGDACRDGCPACARVCPSGAIMFPHHQSPAIAGDPQAIDTGEPGHLTQLLNPALPQDTSRKERDRALSERREEKEPERENHGPSRQLDDLVDDLDQMEL